MHLLGKTIGTYMIKPGQDTVDLIDIPHWDFDWQDFYKFRYLQSYHLVLDEKPMGRSIILH